MFLSLKAHYVSFFLKVFSLQRKKLRCRREAILKLFKQRTLNGGMLKKTKEKLGKRWFFIILILIAIILIFLIAKLYLYINFILGNDTSVKLSSTTEFLSLHHKENASVEYEASVTANPLCKVTCSAEFKDLSSNNLLDEAEFTIQPGTPVKKQYSIISPSTGIGNKLYRFKMQCTSIKTILCHTDEQKATRSSLLILEYNNTDEEEAQYKILEEQIKLSLQAINKIETTLSTLKNASSQLDKHADTSLLLLRESALKDRLFSLKVELSTLTSPENTEPPFILMQKYIPISNKISESENELSSINEALSRNLAVYNLVAKEFKESRSTLASITTPENLTELNATILLFNELVEFATKRNSLEEKQAKLSSLKQKLSKLSNAGNLTNITLPKMVEFNLEPVAINYPEFQPIEITFQEKIKECNLLNKSQKCCTDESCKSQNYPIIIIHGHAISESNSAEYSLEGFNQIQDALEEQGYINGGAITLYTEKTTPELRLGYFNKPFTFRASYYFDVFKEPENYKVVQTKSENIDTYAIRLKELVSIAKYKTGKQKVNIIAFSMGGLVARRYLQIFGSEEVNKLILIGTPNHGTSGEVAAICPVTGGELECRDMHRDSLFINKLNRNQQPDIPVYNILGTGCSMLDGPGDGAVLEESAKLDFAKNFIIKGKCREKFYPLHLDLLNIEMYPEVYEKVKQSLR